MEREIFERLLKQARSDPKFFHDLVFETEKTLSKIDYVDRKSKGRLLAITPEEVMSILVTGIRHPGVPRTECDSTCGPESCEVTCGGSCGDSCEGSCGFTCNLTNTKPPFGIFEIS